MQKQSNRALLTSVALAAMLASASAAFAADKVSIMIGGLRKADLPAGQAGRRTGLLQG